MRVAGTVLALIVVAVAVLWLLQDRFIYHPDRRPPDVGGAPGSAVTLTTSDGLQLGAWHIPPLEPAGAVALVEGRDRDTQVIVTNGNGGNLGDRLLLAEALARRGFGVLLFDYRGYGGNPGRPSEEGLAADADAARRWVDEHHPGDRVVYFGESIGSAVAAGLASRTPPDVLVLRSPFPSLEAVGRDTVRVPVGWFLRDRYDTVAALRSVDAPLLVIVASDDEVVSPALGEKVFIAAREPKRLLEIQARHNDRALLDGAQLINAVEAAAVGDWE